MSKIVIPLPLATLNEYTDAQRCNPYKGAKIKKKATNTCKQYVTYAMQGGVKFDFPCRLKFTWYDRNKRRDPDNIAFQKKFVLDGMVQAGFMENDGWQHIEGFSDYFFVDKKQPRVEIEVEKLVM